MSVCRIVVIAIVFVSFAHQVEARKPKKRKAVAADLNENGYKVGCESTGLSTKDCYVTGDSAELKIKISRAHPVIVSLDELPSFTYNDPYIEHQVTGKFVFFKLKVSKLPKGHNMILRTEKMTITFYFKIVNRDADSQVHIQRSDRAGQDRIVEKRVAEERTVLENEYAKKMDGLEEKAKFLARKQFLNQVYMDGSQVGKPRGEVRNRSDFLVLRATDTIRIGKERLLLISIEERKGEAFPIGDITANVRQNGTKRSLDVDFRCKKMRVSPGSVVDCTLSLGEIDKRKGRALVDVKVGGADGQRAIGLAGVDIL